MCLPTLVGVTQPSICHRLMVTCPPHRCPAGSPSPSFEQATLPLSPDPRPEDSWKAVCIIPPALRVFSAPGAPFPTLSPRHQLPSLGPWDLPSFGRPAVPTACWPVARSCTCRWGPCLPACFPCLGSPSSPAQKALPLLFADTSFVTIGGLVQGTTFPYSQPSQRPSQGTLWPVFSFPRGTPGARLGVAGPCWVTPGSSRSLLQVAEISLLAGWAPAALCVLLGLGPHLGRTPPSCSHHAGQPLC